MRWRTAATRSILRRIPNDSLHLFFLGASPRRTFADGSRNRALRIQIRVPGPTRPPFAPHFRESLRYQAVEIRDRASPKVVQPVREQRAERIFIPPPLYRRGFRKRHRLSVRRIFGLLPAPHRRDDRPKWWMGFLENPGPLFCITHDLTWTLVLLY